MPVHEMRNGKRTLSKETAPFLVHQDLRCSARRSCAAPPRVTRCGLPTFRNTRAPPSQTSEYLFAGADGEKARCPAAIPEADHDGAPKTPLTGKASEGANLEPCQQCLTPEIRPDGPRRLPSRHLCSEVVHLPPVAHPRVPFPAALRSASRAERDLGIQSRRRTTSNAPPTSGAGLSPASTTPSSLSGSHR
jgi:hypothetical protein